MPRYEDTLPLATRLRNEAAEWDVDEPVIGLLVEAAEAIELLAARVAIFEHSKLVEGR